MSLYEIINPSDAVTLEADELAIARIACLLLGEGRYALNDEGGAEVMPLFLFGGFDEWEKEQGFSIKDLIKSRPREIAACLRSAMCCELRDRAAIRAAVGDDPEAMERYNDEKRSSLNDICGRAFKLADRLERDAPKEAPASRPARR